MSRNVKIIKLNIKAFDFTTQISLIVIHESFISVLLNFVNMLSNFRLFDSLRSILVSINKLV